MTVQALSPLSFKAQPEALKVDGGQSKLVLEQVANGCAGDSSSAVTPPDSPRSNEVLTPRRSGTGSVGAPHQFVSALWEAPQTNQVEQEYDKASKAIEFFNDCISQDKFNDQDKRQTLNDINSKLFKKTLVP